MLSEKMVFDGMQTFEPPPNTSSVSLIEEFPIKKTRFYFNNASYTPMSQSAIAAIYSVISSYSLNGPDDQFYLKFKSGSDVAREKLSKFIGSSRPENIVFTESATQSINLVANGFRFQRGDAIITRGGATEHPSNFAPWKHYGEVKGIRIIDLKGDELGIPDLSELDSALKVSKAKLVVVSHVLYNFGTIIPAKEIGRIVHERGALFFLDVSQSVGNIPVNLEEIDCDFAAGTASKWLCGPLGLGFFFCKSESLDYLEPLNFGPNSCQYDYAGNLGEIGLPGRLQEGFRNWAYVYGLSAAIDLLVRFGADLDRRRKNLALSRLIIELASSKLEKSLKLLSSPDDRLRSSIVAFESLGKKPADIVAQLMRSAVVVAEREIGVKRFLRISPHFYNDESEVEKLVQELSRAA
jgi:cysteine desulfurase/selenocysteine lyase